MHDVEAMQVGHAADDLFEIAAGLWLLHFGLLDDIVKQLAVLHVLHHQEEVPAGLDDLVELDDGGVADELEDMDFPRDPLHVGDIDDLLFDEDLDGHPLPGQRVGAQLHLPEGPFADRLPQQVEPYFFILVLPLVHCYCYRFVYQMIIRCSRILRAPHPLALIANIKTTSISNFPAEGTLWALGS